MVSGRMTPSAIESIGYRAMLALYPGARRVGGATLMKSELAPDSPMLNRVVGLGIEQPATEAIIDEISAAMDGVRYFVAISPSARPAGVSEWLSARGFVPGWGWMQFTRSVEDAPAAETNLRIELIGAERSADFARVLVHGFELPPALHDWARAVPAIPGWSAWLALDGEIAVGSGALFVDGELGYLGFGATLESHRGRGSQTAMLAARIRHAAALGCRVVITETGEKLPDRPSKSYRNIVRAGFREEFVVRNWLAPPRAAA
jgi:GNAT superfamily N-acetyltransferase